MMDRALAGVWTEGPALFPEAPAATDVIVQDTSDIFLYSLNDAYPFPKAGRRGRYQVYRLPLAPWGAFRRRQEATGTNYRFEEGYLATMIHEFGHIYEAMRWETPTEDMLEIRRRVTALAAAGTFDAESAQREAFAQWCELLGARDLYPAQFQRLMKQAADDKTGSEHAAGLRAAAEMLEARFPKK